MNMNIASVKALNHMNSEFQYQIQMLFIKGVYMVNIINGPFLSDLENVQ